MIRIPRDHLTYQFSPDLTPVATIDPGDLVVFETYDTSSGRLTSRDDLEAFLRVRDPKKVNPAAGPVFVQGAEPGDELIVEIVDITLARQGWVRIVRGAGVLQSEIDQDGISFVQVEGDELVFDMGLRMPARPMVGVIGTAPATGVIYTAEPGPQGSNIDVNVITVGARVHLPVHVPGALLAIGDVHATMGDGEATGTGVEIPAEVTARVELSKGTAPGRVWIETADAWVTTGHASHPGSVRRDRDGRAVCAPDGEPPRDPHRGLPPHQRPGRHPNRAVRADSWARCDRLRDVSPADALEGVRCLTPSPLPLHARIQSDAPVVTLGAA